MTDATTAVFSHDFDAVAVGERFGSPGRTITESDVVGFAALTGDMHPQHVDAEWARESRFGERVAHGMLVLSYAIGLVPFDPRRIVALRRIGDAVFKRPARLGDTIRVRGRVAEVEVLDERHGLVTTDWKVVNQADQTVARASVQVVWRRGEPNAPPSNGRPATVVVGSGLHEIECGGVPL